jgi:hypothetical protein
MSCVRCARVSTLGQGGTASSPCRAACPEQSVRRQETRRCRTRTRHGRQSFDRIMGPIQRLGAGWLEIDFPRRLSNRSIRTKERGFPRPLSIPLRHARIGLRARHWSVLPACRRGLRPDPPERRPPRLSLLAAHQSRRPQPRLWYQGD